MSANKNYEGMFESFVLGVPFATRVPIEQFPDKWKDEFVRLVKFHAANLPPGMALERITVDHVNLAAETYQPRIDYRMIR